MFNIEEYAASKNDVTSGTEICENFQKTAQELLNHFVRLQGITVSQMLRKSVETRDWLHTIEPRTVRAVMKRVVEDITAIESQVTALYDDTDGQIDRSSDSSRKTHRYYNKNIFLNITIKKKKKKFLTNFLFQRFKTPVSVKLVVLHAKSFGLFLRIKHT